MLNRTGSIILGVPDAENNGTTFIGNEGKSRSTT
jgi:hypothetical protein